MCQATREDSNSTTGKLTVALEGKGKERVRVCADMVADERECCRACAAVEWEGGVSLQEENFLQKRPETSSCC